MFLYSWSKFKKFEVNQNYVHPILVPPEKGRWVRATNHPTAPRGADPSPWFLLRRTGALLSESSATHTPSRFSCFPFNRSPPPPHLRRSLGPAGRARERSLFYSPPWMYVTRVAGGGIHIALVASPPSRRTTAGALWAFTPLYIKLHHYAKGSSSQEK
jgi:hypothetical protein